MSQKSYRPIAYANHILTNFRTGEKKVSAHIVESGEITLTQLSKELAKSTTLTETDVAAVIQGFIEFTMDYLAQGYRIEFGALGKFYPTLAVTPAAYLSKFTVANISRVKARFNASARLKSILAEATFRKGLSRKLSESTIADADQAIIAVVGNEPEEPEEGNGEGNGE